MPLLRSAFILLSQNPALRRFSEDSPIGHKLSSRFVAGTTTGEALQVAKQTNQQHISVTLDSLGENATSPEKARAAGEIYHRLLDAIEKDGLDANVSLKLTQMGMDLDPGLTESIVSGLVHHAAAAKTFVRIDMESTAYTDATLDLVHRLHAAPGSAGCIGVVIQAYLRRSAADIAQLIAAGIRVRLCKGAYQEPPALAFPQKSDVDQNFIQLMQTLLSSGIFHGIATHDERMIEATKQFAKQQGITNFEFQMLYGVRRDLQKALVAEGYRMRVYVPFGTEWYPYFMRRLAERPANAIFLVKHLIR
jgi:proline dehydrogenase